MMNGKERIFAVLQNELPDQVPVIPILMTRAIRCLPKNVSAAVCQKDAELMAQAKIFSSVKFGGDAIAAGTDLFLPVENLGAGMEYLDKAQPTLFKHPCPTGKEFDLMLERSNNFDPSRGRVLTVAQELKILHSKGYGDSHLLFLPLGGPATTAQLMTGSTRFIDLMEQDPALCHQILRVATNTIKSICNVMADAGAHAINMLEPFCSSDIMPPSQFRIFSKPYLIEIFDHMKSIGLAPILHICTFTQPIWQDMKETGAIALNGDFWPGIDVARNIVGDDFCLAGSINPFTTMLSGTTEQVRQETLKCIATAGKNGAFICTPGCDIDWNVPDNNIHALVQTCASVKYPLDIEALGDLSKTYVSGAPQHRTSIDRKGKFHDHQPKKNLSIQEQLLQDLANCVVNQDGDNVVALVTKGLGIDISAEDLLFNGMALGMQVCGDMYDRNEIFVIDLMRSAKAMDRGVAILLPLINQTRDSGQFADRTSVVIGLIRGNTQDIGKNLVSLILTSHGYDVHDLGKNVSPEEFIAAAEKTQAKVIAISIMTNSSIVYVERFLQLLTEHGTLNDYFIICGGAAMNKELALALGVHFSANASDAVQCLNDNFK